MREALLLITVAAVVVLSLAGYIFWALLIGVAGALALAARAGEGKSFEPVEVPPAGGYPGWDFWKKTLEDLGTLTGGVFKSATKIDKVIDIWGDYVKGSVWKAGSSSSEWVPSWWIQKYDKNVHLLQIVQAPIIAAMREVQALAATARSEEERRKLLAAHAKLNLLLAKSLTLAKEKKVSDKFMEEYKKTMEAVEKLLSGSGD